MNQSPVFSGKPFNVIITAKPVLVLAAAGLLSLSALSFGAGACKGQAQDACSSDDSCSWVNSYTTKKGNTINAYCRNKSKPAKSSVVPDSNAKARPDKQG